MKLLCFVLTPSLPHNRGGWVHMVPALQGAVALASDGGLESTKLMNKKRTAATPWGSKISDTSDISLAFGFGNHRLRHNGWKFV